MACGGSGLVSSAAVGWSTRVKHVRELSQRDAESPAMWPVTFKSPLPGWIINPEYGACLVTGEAVVSGGRRFFRVNLVQPLSESPVSETMYSVPATVVDFLHTMVDYVQIVPAIVLSYRRNDTDPGSSVVAFQMHGSIIEMTERELADKISPPVPQDPALANAWSRFRQSNELYFTRLGVGVKHMYSPAVRKLMEAQTMPQPVATAISCAICDREHKRLHHASIGSSLNLDALFPPKQ